jgi:hypothetical protein
MQQPKVQTKQLDNEPMQDYIKFLVFLNLGATRTLNQAYQKYYETANEVSSAWQGLATKYSWTDRAAKSDAH